MKRWSDEAWEAALPVYRKILGHPFVRELADGTLPAEQFRHYIRQDALYLDGYARRLAHVASRLTRREHTEAFLHFALDGIAVERALHAQFLAGDAPTRDEMSPACLLYTALLIVEFWLMVRFAKLGPSSLGTGRYFFERKA